MTTIKSITEKEKISAFLDDDITQTQFVDFLCHDDDAQQTWKQYHLIGDLMRADTKVLPEWDIAASVALAIENEAAPNPVSTSRSDATMEQSLIGHVKSPMEQATSSPAAMRSSSKPFASFSKEPTAPKELTTPKESTDVSAQENNLLSFAKAKAALKTKGNKGSGKTHNWFGIFGQLAVAASVCFVAVVGVNHFSPSQPIASATTSGDTNAGIPVLQTIPLAGVAEPVSLTAESLAAHRINHQPRSIKNDANAMFQDYELQLKLNANAQPATQLGN